MILHFSAGAMLENHLNIFLDIKQFHFHEIKWLSHEEN